jgi:hypothetical protein
MVIHYTFRAIQTNPTALFPARTTHPTTEATLFAQVKKANPMRLFRMFHSPQTSPGPAMPGQLKKRPVNGFHNPVLIVNNKPGSLKDSNLGKN